ncbi:MAG: hypothetical protein KFB96_06495 [Thiocapsa sp.]|uniref:acylneuraminate cytidylyltransferase family protein n=1 Tax=Thiocapsa sp. TaxID=2024551 RepID=UPI001BD18E58|nr:hypothetical protein [Thiocapsa sp.]QVL50109.1 MAG: hypothetical protein KFB96_06495 [Thiocapsa sp.]
MKNLGKIVGHIPARAGSKRVPAKNLRLIDNAPLLSYAVNAALASCRLNEVVVNTDGLEISKLAKSLGAKVFMRDAQYATDSASGDDFNHDFISKWYVDTLVMINPVCPLINTSDIDAALDAYAQDDTADTLITVQSTQMQVFFEAEPVNITLGGHLAPTQQNRHVDILNWAVTIWDAKAYQNRYQTGGDAYIGRQRLLFSIEPLHAIKISTEEDFRLAEAVLKARRLACVDQAPVYWRDSQ